MDSNAVEKFAELFAKCAATGDTAPLRKEASAQKLVKEAISASQLLMPLGGAAIGGAAGYLGTDDEKRKLRNALYGALTGGITGVGAQLAAPAIKSLLYGDTAAAPAAAAGGGAFNVADKPADKPAATAAAATAPATPTPKSAPAPAAVTPTAPAAPVTAPAAPAAPETAQTTAKEESRPIEENKIDVAGPMTLARNKANYVFGGANALGGAAIAPRFSPERYSGRGREFDRLPRKGNEDIKALQYALQNPAAKSESFLRPAPVEPATPTPKPHVSPPAYARMSPADQAAVRQQAATYQAEQARHARWEERMAERAKTMPQKLKQVERMRQTGSLGDVDERSLVSRLLRRPDNSRRANLPVLQEMLNARARAAGGGTGANSARMDRLVQDLDGSVPGAPTAKGGRTPPTPIRQKMPLLAPQRIAGAVGLGVPMAVGGNYALENMQSAAANAFDKNPNYGLGDLWNDTTGTVSDIGGGIARYFSDKVSRPPAPNPDRFTGSVNGVSPPVSARIIDALKAAIMRASEKKQQVGAAISDSINSAAPAAQAGGLDAFSPY